MQGTLKTCVSLSQEISCSNELTPLTSAKIVPECQVGGQHGGVE